MIAGGSSILKMCYEQDCFEFHWELNVKRHTHIDINRQPFDCVEGEGGGGGVIQKYLPN